MAWILVNLRRLRDERATAIGFAVLILVTALLAAGAPRAFNRLGDDTLQAELALRTPLERNIQFIETGVFGVGDTSPLSGIEAEGTTIDETIPKEIRDLIGQRQLLVEGVRWSVKIPGLHDPSTLRLRIQPSAADRIQLTAGRLPAAAAAPSALAPDATPTPLEIALSNTNAAALGVKIGDSIPLQMDTTDTLIFQREPKTSSATVVGLFDVPSPDDPVWLADSTLARPFVRRPGGDAQFLDMAGLLSPDEYFGLAWTSEASGSFLRYTFQDFVDPTRIRQRDVASLVPAFRRLEARYPIATPRNPNTVALRTALRAFLESESARWTSATALLIVAIVGPVAVAVAALGMVAVLAARRRRAALSLSRGRGASVRQVTVASVAEGLLLALPAAAIGAAIGSLVAPNEPLVLPAATGVVVALVAVALLTAATVPATGGPAFGSGRELSVPRAPTPRRLVFEGLIVLLAGVGALLLRERGLRPDGSLDPLVAAVPALVGVAAGLVALRLVPLPTRFLAWLARLRRGLVGVIAMRRAAGGAGAPVLLVLLATTTIGAFSIAALGYLDRSAETAGWQAVGADFRVVASQDYLRRDFDFGSLPGVTAAATAFTGTASVTAHGSQPDLVVLDAEAYDNVTAGTPAAVQLPVDLYGPAAEPVPVVIARGLEDRADGMKLGETLQVSVQGYTFNAKAVADLPSFPGVSGTSFMIVSQRQLHTLFPDAPLRPTVAYLRAPADDGDAIRAAVAGVMTNAVVSGRTDTTDQLRDAPIVRAVRLGIAATAVTAAIYAALAVAAALALGGAARTTENAHLRTLGLSDRQALGALLLEQGPTLAFAFVAGLALGLGLLTLLLPGLRLDRLMGVDVAVTPGLDPTLLVAMAAGFVLVALVGLLAGLWLGRRVSAVAALRRGFE
jgi:putative ABC transport system permease protein